MNIFLELFLLFAWSALCLVFLLTNHAIIGITIMFVGYTSLAFYEIYKNAFDQKLLKP